MGLQFLAHNGSLWLMGMEKASLHLSAPQQQRWGHRQAHPGGLQQLEAVCLGCCRSLAAPRQQDVP